MRQIISEHTKKKKIAISFVILTILLLSITSVVSAADNPPVDYYKNASRFYETNNLFSSCLRSLGWGLVKLLYQLSSACEKLWTDTFKFLDFTTWGPLGEWIESYGSVVVALMCLSILALGIMMIVSHKKEHHLLQRIVLTVFVLTASSFALTQINKAINVGLETERTNTIAAIDAIKTNMYSLVELNDKVGNLGNLKNDSKPLPGHGNALSLNDLTESQINTLDPNMVLNHNTKESKDTKTIPSEVAEKYLKYKLYYPYPGAETTKDVFNGIGINWPDDTDFGNEFYYNYTFEWLNIFALLISLIVVFLGLAYKVVRIVFEITWGRILAYFYAAELSNEQRLVKILCGIRDNYIVLFFNILLVRVFTFAFKYITESGKFEGLTKTILILIIGFCTVDGPNLIEKVVGIDAGLGSGLGKLMAARGLVMGGARMAGRAATGAAKGYKNIGMALMTGTSAQDRKWKGSLGERIAAGKGISGNKGEHVNAPTNEKEQRDAAMNGGKETGSGGISGEENTSSMSPSPEGALSGGVSQEMNLENSTQREEEAKLNGFNPEHPRSNDGQTSASKSERMNSAFEHQANKSNLGSSGIGRNSGGTTATSNKIPSSGNLETKSNAERNINAKRNLGEGKQDK